MMPLASEQATGIYPLQLGEATINLTRPPSGVRRRINILSEIGVEEQLAATPVRAFQLRSLTGDTINIEQSQALSAFDAIMEDIASSLTREVEPAVVHGLRVLIATPETFRAIRRNNPLPDWVGVYTKSDGTVVYNADYIRTMLAGDGKFNGHNFDKQYFYDEAVHEMLHSYEDSIFFHNDEKVAEHFSRTSLWFIEGLKESLARHLSAMPHEEFIEKLREIRRQHPDFSIQKLQSGFWQYDESPTHINIGYQYCRQFMIHLSKIISERVRQRGEMLDSEKYPYQATYWLLNESVKRYKAGKRESIIDAMAAPEVLGLPREELFRIEKEWVDGLLKQE